MKQGDKTVTEESNSGSPAERQNRPERDAVPRKSKAELPLNEERFHLLVESVMDYAIFMLDPDGYIVSWNRGAQKIKGYTEDEIVGRHFSVFYTADDVASHHPQDELRIATEEGKFEEEGWRVRKDGSLFWANVLITAVFGEDGTLRGFAKVTRDITQRREMEQRLKDLNRQLESFAYSVSHDLRAPLRNIAFTSKLLIEDYTGIIDEEGRVMLDSLACNAAKLAKVISDLLNLSRLSRAEMKKEKIDVTSLVMDIWRDILSKTDGDPSHQIRPDPDMIAFADRTLLTVVLMNLIDNAVKFSPNGARVKVGVTTSAGKRVYFVQDEGIGFDMHYAHKVFQPFERLVSDEVAPGSGIGLANVQQAVLRHGGRIWVESVPNVGTTFFFIL